MEISQKHFNTVLKEYNNIGNLLHGLFKHIHKRTGQWFGGLEHFMPEYARYSELDEIQIYNKYIYLCEMIYIKSMAYFNFKNNYIQICQ